MKRTSDPLFPRIKRGALALELGLILVGGGAIGFMMLLTTVDVVLRWLFNSPIPGTFELMEFMMAGAVFLGLAYVERIKGHIAIDFLSTRLSPATQGTIRIIGYVLALVVFGVITWKTGQNAYTAWRISDYTLGAIQLPTWPARSAVPLGTGMLCARLFAQAVMEVTSIVRRHFPRQGVA